MLKSGLYEQIINKELEEELLHTDKFGQTAPIDSAKAIKELSKYIAQVVEQGLMQYIRAKGTKSEFLL